MTSAHCRATRPRKRRIKCLLAARCRADGKDIHRGWRRFRKGLPLRILPGSSPGDLGEFRLKSLIKLCFAPELTDAAAHDPPPTSERCANAYVHALRNVRGAEPPMRPHEASFDT